MSAPPIRSLLSAAAAFLLLSMGKDAFAQVQVRRGPNFVVLTGASGVDGCLPRDLAKRTLRDRVLAANEAAGIDPTIAVVFSLEVPPCADMFYAPVENDVRGIGYQHLYPEELFDESPDAALEGVAFLNDVPYWEFYPDELRRAFLHEVGHRWGVRVHVAGEEPTALLGRDHEHFSYFLNTASIRGVSPLEGNAWEGAVPEFWTTTEDAQGGYSDLDLYLMGVKAPAEVAPFRLLIPEDGQELPLDCDEVLVSAGSPPQRCEQVQLRASERIFSIADVIAVEGPRDPQASEGTVVVDVGFYFLSAAGDWTLGGCQHWEQEVTALQEAFQRATDGRMTLSNVTPSNVTPSDVTPERNSCGALMALLEAGDAAETASWRSPSSGCAINGRRKVPLLPSGLLLAALLRLRRGNKKVPG